jgi:DNA polymerase-3 subunit delta'
MNWSDIDAAPSHDALPDIPSPAQNRSLFGHATQMDELARSFRAGRLHHALIFAGPKGIGKATAAYRLARHVVRYSDPSAAPETILGVSEDDPIYRQIVRQAHHGLLAIERPQNDRGGFKTVITVDEIRRIGGYLAKRAHDNGFRVVIVDAADDMNRNAANALLKSLEEPPAKTVFILIAHQPARLIPTIRSRCSLVRFEPLNDTDLLAVLGELAIAAPADSALAEAGGSVRQVIQNVAFGGADIVAEIDRAAALATLDVAQAQTVATGLTAKDMALQFQMFCDAVRQKLEQSARGLAGQGCLARAADLSERCSQFDTMRHEVETYNLDRKNFIVSALELLTGTARPGGPV